MPTLADAIELAARAHRGQLDKKTGQPYILHPLGVMAGVEGEAAQMAAVLHDVVEDTDVTVDDLRRAGYGEDVIGGIEAVTRRSDETYTDFVIRAAAHPIGRQVKLADLRDNYNLPRAMMREGTIAKDLNRVQRYLLSHAFIEGDISERAYREAMKPLEK